MAHPSGIRRLDTSVNPTHAWTFTVQRRGRIVRKYFSDGVYGSRTAAYDAALARSSPPSHCKEKRSCRPGILFEKVRQREPLMEAPVLMNV